MVERAPFDGWLAVLKGQRVAVPGERHPHAGANRAPSDAIAPWLRIALAVWVALVCTTAQAADWRKQGELRVGARENAAPLSFRGPDGQFTGYSVEFCRLVLERLRRLAAVPVLRLRYVPVRSVDDALRLLETGQLDLECGVTVANDERRQRVDFAVPHFYSTSRFIANAALNAERLDQLGREKVAVVRGSTTAVRLGRRVTSGMSQMRLVEVATADEGLGLLADRQVAAFANFEVQLYAWRANQANPEAYRIGADPIFIEPVAVAFPRQDAEFKRLVDIAVAHVMLDGQLSRLYRHWFQSSASPAGLDLGVPMSSILQSTIAAPVR